MNAMVAVVGLLLAGAPVPEAKAPRDIVDFYAALARDKKLDPVLHRDGKGWKVQCEIEGEIFDSTKTLIMDGKNGYLKYGFQNYGRHMWVTLALFTTTGAKKLIAMQITESSGRTDETLLTLYEFSGAAYRDVTTEAGLPSVLDFLDSKYVPSKEPGLRPNDLMSVSYELPREGTTVQANLSLEKGDSDSDDPLQVAIAKASADAAAHLKARTLLVTWSAATGKFTLPKAR